MLLDIKALTAGPVAPVAPVVVFGKNPEGEHFRHLPPLRGASILHDKYILFSS
jgi:hypothetical protein